jgi:hypothetical protein
MTSKKKKQTILLLLIHFIGFLFTSGIMYIIYTKADLSNEALVTTDQTTLMKKNVKNALVIGLTSMTPLFLMWQFYLLPMMMKEEA